MSFITPRHFDDFPDESCDSFTSIVTDCEDSNLVDKGISGVDEGSNLPDSQSPAVSTSHFNLAASKLRPYQNSDASSPNHIGSGSHILPASLGGFTGVDGHSQILKALQQRPISDRGELGAQYVAYTPRKVQVPSQVLETSPFQELKELLKETEQKTQGDSTNKDSSIVSPSVKQVVIGDHSFQDVSMDVQESKPGGLTGDVPRLEIIEEPEETYRARYESEGCRGPIHGETENSYPTVKVVGYLGDVVMIVYLVTKEGEPHLHSVNGPGSTKCHTDETKIQDDIPAIKMFLGEAQDMTAVWDCLSVRRIRNWEADRLLRMRGIDPGTWKNKKKEARLMFQVNIPPQPNNKNGFILTCQSRPFLCTAPSGSPEIWWTSISEGSPKGGEEMGIIGKKFSSGFRVRFFAFTDDGSLWEAYAEIERQKSHQGACVVKTPPYKDPECNVFVTVNVEIRVGSDKDPRCSDPITFTYGVKAPPTGGEDACLNCSKFRVALQHLFQGSSDAATVSSTSRTRSSSDGSTRDEEGPPEKICPKPQLSNPQPMEDEKPIKSEFVMKPPFPVEQSGESPIAFKVVRPTTSVMALRSNFPTKSASVPVVNPGTIKVAPVATVTPQFPLSTGSGASLPSVSVVRQLVGTPIPLQVNGQGSGIRLYQTSCVPTIAAALPSTPQGYQILLNPQTQTVVIPTHGNFVNVPYPQPVVGAAMTSVISSNVTPLPSTVTTSASSPALPSGVESHSDKSVKMDVDSPTVTRAGSTVASLSHSPLRQLLVNVPQALQSHLNSGAQEIPSNYLETLAGLIQQLRSVVATQTQTQTPSFTGSIGAHLTQGTQLVPCPNNSSAGTMATIGSHSATTTNTMAVSSPQAGVSTSMPQILQVGSLDLELKRLQGLGESAGSLNPTSLSLLQRHHYLLEQQRAALEQRLKEEQAQQAAQQDAVQKQITQHQETLHHFIQQQAVQQHIQASNQQNATPVQFQLRFPTSTYDSSNIGLITSLAPAHNSPVKYELSSNHQSQPVHFHAQPQFAVKGLALSGHQHDTKQSSSATEFRSTFPSVERKDTQSNPFESIECSAQSPVQVPETQMAFQTQQQQLMHHHQLLQELQRQVQQQQQHSLPQCVPESQEHSPHVIQQQQSQPSPQAMQQQPQPSPQAIQQQPLPSPQAMQQQPQPSPQAMQRQPQPSPQVMQQQPQPSPQAMQQQPQPSPQAMQQQQATSSYQAVQQQHQPAPSPQSAKPSFDPRLPNLLQYECGSSNPWNPGQCFDQALKNPDANPQVDSTLFGIYRSTSLPQASLSGAILQASKFEEAASVLTSTVNVQSATHSQHMATVKQEQSQSSMPSCQLEERRRRISERGESTESLQSASLFNATSSPAAIRDSPANSQASAFVGSQSPSRYMNTDCYSKEHESDTALESSFQQSSAGTAQPWETPCNPESTTRADTLFQSPPNVALASFHSDLAQQSTAAKSQAHMFGTGVSLSNESPVMSFAPSSLSSPELKMGFVSFPTGVTSVPKEPTTQTFASQTDQSLGFGSASQVHFEAKTDFRPSTNTSHETFVKPQTPAIDIAPNSEASTMWGPGTAFGGSGADFSRAPYSSLTPQPMSLTDDSMFEGTQINLESEPSNSYIYASDDKVTTGFNVTGSDGERAAPGSHNYGMEFIGERNAAGTKEIYSYAHDAGQQSRAEKSHPDSSDARFWGNSTETNGITSGHRSSAEEKEDVVVKGHTVHWLSSENPEQNFDPSQFINHPDPSESQVGHDVSKYEAERSSVPEGHIPFPPQEQAMNITDEMSSMDVSTDIVSSSDSQALSQSYANSQQSTELYQASVDPVGSSRGTLGDHPSQVRMVSADKVNAEEANKFYSHSGYDTMSTLSHSEWSQGHDSSSSGNYEPRTTALISEGETPGTTVAVNQGYRSSDLSQTMNVNEEQNYTQLREEAFDAQFGASRYGSASHMGSPSFSMDNNSEIGELKADVRTLFQRDLLSPEDVQIILCSAQRLDSLLLEMYRSAKSEKSSVESLALTLKHWLTKKGSGES